MAERPNPAEPMISVIIPVYKVEEYLDECVRSVLSQDCGDYELILIDDGSPDRCPQLCDEYAARYEQIRVIHQENRGLSGARNSGILAARGTFLLFLDSDDKLSCCDALSQMTAALEQSGADVLLYSEIEYDESFKEVLLEHELGEWEEGKAFPASQVIDPIYRDSVLWITQSVTKVVRREFLIGHELTFTCGLYHEDDEWTARLYLSGPRICFLKQRLYAYRHRRESITASTDQRMNLRKRCDKVRIGATMLSLSNAKKHRDYMEYAAEYFLNSILSAASMDETLREEFIRYVKPFRRVSAKAVYTKNPKRIAKAAILYCFGVRFYLAFYRKKLNGRTKEQE